MEKNQKRRGKRKKWLLVLGIILIVIIAFRIYLPTLVLNYVNKTLSQIDGYDGHVDDIDIHLWRGAYIIQGIRLDKTGEKKIPVPFFSAEELDLSVEWNALLHGSIVGEIEVVRPQLNFVKGPTKEDSQTDVDKDWTKVVKDLLPLRINRFDIVDGEVHYQDFHQKPPIDIFSHNINITALNLTNSASPDELLPSTVQASANTLGDGKFWLKIALDPLKQVPTFDLNAELSNVNMVKLNDFLKAYANIDVKKGTFGLYTEVAAKDGKFNGYVKPLLADVDIVQWNKEEGNALQIAWETIAEAAAEVFENQRKDRVATKIPLSGKFANPEIGIWATIGNLLRNAFIEALNPTIENSININQVENIDKEEKSPDKKEARKERRKERREERKKNKQ